MCLYFLAYVDDVVITGSDPVAISSLITTLGSYFPVKDLGKLHCFLGVEVHHLRSGLLFSKRKYMKNLLQKRNMHLSKPNQTPMATTGHLWAHKGAAFEDPTLYKSTVGNLQYLSFMRPDLAYVVNRVCQYMHAP